MADEVMDSPQPVGGAGGSAPEVSASVVESPAAASVADTQVGGGLAAQQGAGVTPAPAPAGLQSVRDVVAGYGVDVGQFADDAQALQALAYGYRGYQSARPHIELSSRWLPYASEIETFLRGRQQQAQPPGRPPAPPWHGLPEFNPMWRHQITRGEQGEYVPIPGSGATLETVRKFQEYAQARRDFEDRFYTDPITALKPGLEEFVQPLVQQAIHASLQQMQEHQHARSFVQQHADWLYARDAQGRELADPITGGKVLTPFGQKFGGYLQEAHSLGVQGAVNQQKYAQALLERDLALMGAWQGVQPQGAPAPNEQQRQPNRGGTLNGILNDGAPPQNRLLRLEDQLRQGYAAAGIRREDLQVPVGGLD